MYGEGEKKDNYTSYLFLSKLYVGKEGEIEDKMRIKFIADTISHFSG